MSQNEELLQDFPAIDDSAFVPSSLKGVFFFQEKQHITRRAMGNNPGLCIVLQGNKIGYLDGKRFPYDARHYLVTSIVLPFECETFANPDKPLRGIYIDIDMGQLHDLIGKTNFPLKPRKAGQFFQWVGPAYLEEEMENATKRLLRCLKSEEEAQILGPHLVHEILYRALYGNQAPILYSLAMYSGIFSQISRVLKTMQNHYAEKLDVERLANDAHLSVSAFHRAFKELTSDSPMQYLKKIRLLKAKDFLMQEKMKVCMAANKVGYESSSQFSREFKRYFGQSPGEMVKKSRIIGT